MSLQHAILGLLTYGPMTGYELKSVFDGSINHFWTAQQSQIYRDLGSLEKKGCVTYNIEQQEGRPNKKIYSITEEGRKSLQEWLEVFPNKLSCDVRDEILVRIFFGSRIAPDEIKKQMQKIIAESQEQLDNYRSMELIMDQQAREIGRPEEAFFWKLTLKRGILSAEATIRWARECIGELEAHQ